jgi:hypothetical protein
MILCGSFISTRQDRFFFVHSVTQRSNKCLQRMLTVFTQILSTVPRNTSASENQELF